MNLSVQYTPTEKISRYFINNLTEKAL